MKVTEIVGLITKSIDYTEAILPIINEIGGNTAEMVENKKMVSIPPE